MIAIVKHLEGEMAAAHEAGDDHAFTVSRNKRENVWRYVEGQEGYDLARVKYSLAKVPAVQAWEKPESTCAVCVAWDGDITDPDEVSE